MDTKDIMLRITGSKFDKEGEKDDMEFVTEGKMYERNGARYLIYDESEFSGFPGCKTSLKLKGDSVRMRRMGDELGSGTVMEFQSGKRFTGKYDTPYGVMDMEILTDHVDNKLDKDGLGIIDIAYHVSVAGDLEGHNELKIEVAKEAGKASPKKIAN